MRVFLSTMRMVSLAGVFFLASCMTLEDKPWEIYEGKKQGATFYDLDFLSDYALEELVRAQYIVADSYADKILAEDANNEVALFVKGVVYQNTGNLENARDLYKNLLGLSPQKSFYIKVEDQVMRYSVEDMARLNLAIVEDALHLQNPSKAIIVFDKTGISGYKDAQELNFENVMDRFLTLKALLNEQLMLPSEYNERYEDNLGALLIFTYPPPGRGLQLQPVPLNDIISRLFSLQSVVDLKNITGEEYIAERKAILDAILPYHKKEKGYPYLRPETLVELAFAKTRLSRIYRQGLISEVHYEEEKAELDHWGEEVAKRELERENVGGGTSTYLQRQKSEMMEAQEAQIQQEKDAILKEVEQRSQELLAEQSTNYNNQLKMELDRVRLEESAKAKEREEKLQDELNKLKVGVPYVHILSFKDKEDLLVAWEKLQQTSAMYKGFVYDVDKISLPDQGDYYRLNIGPFDLISAAEKFCDQLKNKKQYCRLTFVK